MPYAYILRSLKDRKYYYGSTRHLEQRLISHNAGRVRATKGRRPMVLHYSEHFDTITEAIKREKFFKSKDGYRWLHENGVIKE
jgi:putative endonuclease